MMPVKLWSLVNHVHIITIERTKDPSYTKTNSEPQEKQGTLFHGDE